MEFLHFSLWAIDMFAWMPPYWSSVEFVIVCWLVIPEFEGASLAYERLVTPAVLAKLQKAVDLYNKIKEKERVSKRERFSDAVEKYIKENGFEALEKLIESKKQHETQKCTDSMRDTKNVEPEGENTAAESNRNQHEKQKSTDSQIDAKIIETERENTSATSNKVYANSEEITPPSTENRLPQTPPLEKTHPKWTCDLCNVTTTSESTLNAHLQGRNHKSNIESLKSSLLDADDAASASWRRNVQAACAEAQRILLPKVTAEKRPQWYCDLCKVTTTGPRKLKCSLSREQAQLQARDHPERRKEPPTLCN